MTLSYDSQQDPLQEDIHFPQGEYALEELFDWDRSNLEELDTNRLSQTPPYTLAAFLNRLHNDERSTVLRLVPEELASRIVSEMDSEQSAETVETMRDSAAVQILEDLDPDDATDLLEGLEEDTRDRLLEKLAPATAETVKNLLTYNKDTAGGMMNPHVMTVNIGMTIDEAIQSIRAQGEKTSHIYYVYVVDDENYLEGVINMRDILLASLNQKVSDITETQLKGVCLPNEDREAVALTMAGLNLMALPVIDTDRHLLGVVTHDDVIDVVQAEATEDIQRLVGAGPDETIHAHITYSIVKRNPWLLVNLMTATFASTVIYHFQENIGQYTLLAVLMPIIASLGGNAGAQTLAVAIRSIALGEIQAGERLTICLRELFKGLCNGTIVGLVGAGIIWFITHDTKLCLVIFLACMLNMGIAGLAGASVPLILQRLHFDPAQSASIFLTAITDFMGFSLFLGLGSWILLG